MATEDVDYYALLGIEATATSAEIRKAYRQKSLRVHPDRNPDDPQAAALFHELSIAADVLSDPTQRASFDALLAARNARKARFAALDNKRKALAEDLEAREREFKKQKAGEATEAQRKRQELERLKEEGRKLREMKTNQANAGEEARKREEADQEELQRRAREAANGGAAAVNGPAGVVELGPLDKTLKVKWQKSVHPALGSAEAVATFFRTALAPHDPDIDSAVLSSKTLAQPSKGKFGSGVVAFRSLTAAVRAVKGKAADPDGLWKGFEVEWAAGQPPAALGTAPTVAPAATAPSVSQPPAPKPKQVDADEDAVLAKMRQRERERERLMEEMRRQDEEEAGGSATAPASPHPSPPPPPPPPHPFLSKPELYVSGLSSSAQVTEIVHVLRDCLRLRLHFERDPKDVTATLSGKIEFESVDRAERAYATCNHTRVGAHSGSLELSIHRDALLDPVPAAQTLMLKQLPNHFTPSELYDLARPFGAVQSARLLFSTPRSGLDAPTFKGQGVVTYYDQQHAEEARAGLHLVVVKGQNIAVQLCDSKRGARSAVQPTTTLPPLSTSSHREGAGFSGSSSSYGSASSPGTPSPLERKSAALLGLGISTQSREGAAPALAGRNSSASKWAVDRADGPDEDQSASVGPRRVGGGGGPQHATSSDVDLLSSGTSCLLVDKEAASPQRSASATLPTSASAPPKSKRARFAQQVALLVKEEKQQETVLSLLCELPKRERALCLTNPDYLGAKVKDALTILEIDEEENGGEEKRGESGPEVVPAPPDSLADLAAWPCGEILRHLPALAQRFSLPVPPRSEVDETRTFMSSLKGNPASMVKQSLGERLFKAVKAHAKDHRLKRAGRITIELLDSADDLDALAEVMHYPAILREKVLLTAHQLEAQEC
ncbi:hypothetical protein JCM3774_002865 [Rhodotorula dairenensis]